MIKDNKLNYTLELIILLSIYIILAPIFEAIISPFIKLFIDNSLSINLILIELAKFSIINILLLKVKNEKLKKLLIFLSMFTYTLGYNLLMFLMTIAFQNIKKFNYINIVYTYFIILIGMIVYKYRMLSLIDYLGEVKYIFINTLIILFIVSLINMIIFIKYKNIILESNIIKTVLNTCIISIVIYLTLFHYLDVSFGYESLELKNQLLVSSSLAFINMCIFYCFNINIYEERIRKMIYLLFTYYILYLPLNMYVSYKIIALLILIYDIILIYSQYRKIKLDKIERIFNSVIVGIFIFLVVGESSLLTTRIIEDLIKKSNYIQMIVSFMISIVNIFIAYYYNLTIFQKKVNLLIISLFIYFIIASLIYLQYSYKAIAGIIIVYDIIILIIEYRNKKRSRRVDNNEKN